MLTNAQGYYLFTERTDAAGFPNGVALAPGNYQIGISRFNFIPAGAPAQINGQPFNAGSLAGYVSSGTSISNAGSISEIPIAANGTTDSNADNFDDGTKQGAGYYTGGVLSGLITLQVGAEPTNETTQPSGATGGQTPGLPNTVNAMNIGDSSGNTTVDFGFYRLQLGDVVFSDTGAGAAYNNGIFDNSESPVPGVTVKLFSQDGTTEIPVGPDGILGTADDAPGGVVTNGSGQYLFSGLPEGSYIVRITAPTGTVSSGDIASTPNPNGNVNSDDNGVGASGGTISSNPVTLTPGSTGTLNNNQVTPANGTTKDPTVDFGILQPAVAIGNTVWFDTNNNGIIEPIETASGGVLVDLFFDASGNNTLEDNTGTGGVNELIPVARQLTNANGHYLFTETTTLLGIGSGQPLVPGNYFVGVSPFNFNPAGAPATIGGQPFTAGMLIGYVSSGTSINGTGVVSEASFGTTDSNADNNDDGTKQTTGFYTGGALSGLLNVQVGQEPANETTNPTGTTGGQTFGYNNTVGGLPGGLNIGDNSSNLTVDFGFYKLQLGDVVWMDSGMGAFFNNGLLDAGEAPLAGIPVRLYAANGTTEIPVGPDGILGTADDAPGGVLTDANGKYLFSGLPAGDYVVKVQAPTGYLSSTDVATTPTPNNNINSDDNGVGTGSGTISSNPVTLTPGLTGAANNNTVTSNIGSTYNPTVDFGLVPPPVSIGNQVWYDANNNGIKDGPEAPINGVTVQLFADADADGQPDTNYPLATTTTAGTGLYLFTQQTTDPNTGDPVTPQNLVPGKYVVVLPATNFLPGAPLSGLFSSGTSITLNGSATEVTAPDPNIGGSPSNPGVDNDDNGTKQTNGSVISRTIDVGLNEPLSENPDNDPNTADVNENLTIDFGFYGMSLGNLVWLDNGAGGGALNDGIRQPGEPVVPGVIVRLIAADGVTVLGVTTTDASGRYLFSGLPQGTYIVEVDTTGPLAGLTSSANPGECPQSECSGQRRQRRDHTADERPLGAGVAGAWPGAHG